MNSSISNFNDSLDGIGGSTGGISGSPIEGSPNSAGATDSPIGSNADSPQSRLRKKRYFGWGLVGLIVLLVAVDVGVFRNLDFYGLSPYQFIGQMAVVDRSFEEADADRIRIAILGDSQAIDALRPEFIARPLHRDPDEVFNFSISGGKAFEIAKMYERYMERMPNLQEVMVVVNEHQINNADADKDPKFKFYATFKERLAVMNRDNYGELLLGWAFKAFDMRTEWIKMVTKYRKGELLEEVPFYTGGLPAVTYSVPNDNTKSHAMEVADSWFESYQLEGVRTAAFERMIQELTDRHVRVAIVQLPRMEVFEEAIRDQYSKEQAAYFREMETVAARYGAAFEVMSNDALRPEDFRDTNHVNPEGAKQVSQYAAEHFLAQ